MTVAELISELQKLPADLEVLVEAYDGRAGDGIVCTPNLVEGLENGLGERSAVIWARGQVDE